LSETYERDRGTEIQGESTTPARAIKQVDTSQKQKPARNCYLAPNPEALCRNSLTGSPFCLHLPSGNVKLLTKF